MFDISIQNEIQTRLDAQTEWLLVRATGKSFALKNTEIEISHAQNKLLFGFLDDNGFQTWRIVDYKIENTAIVFNLTRNFGKEKERIRLISRVSAADLSAELELARLEKANKIAELIIENFPKTKLASVRLNKENGRYAQIIIESSGGRQTAVLADVTDTLTPEITISTAVLWLLKLENRTKKPIETIWITSESKAAKNLQKLHALLRESWKRKITIKEISRKSGKSNGENTRNSINELSSLEIKDLWREKPKEIRAIENAQISRASQEIIELAPEEIDVIFSKYGETLRFLGLPFARVRKVFDKEKIWYGIERNRLILTGNNRKELLELVGNLKIYRRFDSPNRRHAFYNLAPEAWLEAVLRRNIKRLDANLILSPIYHQFRTGKDRIDLLALRRDGRLVIVEIKAAPDREMIFQVADYWRKIELQRRKGNLKKARIFGDMEISDKPPLVYLVAPTFSYHRDYDFLARTISPEIEFYRFDLNENWRENLKVLERREN